MLCATLREDSIADIKVANRKADLIELRLDLFTPSNLSALRSACQKPVIFKMNQFDPKVIACSPDYIDLPFGADFTRIPSSVRRICSYHDYERTPILPALYAEMQKCPADYYKIATWACTSHDALRMLEFVRKTKCIGLCMGEKGVITRVLAPIFGVPWTYAPLKFKTAPGQLLLDDLINTYHYHTLSPKTALYGLIGDPVSKSIGHRMHNFAFAKLGLDAVYVKMTVKKEELSSFLYLCPDIGFRGLSVTMPLKELIIEGKAINTLGFSDQKMECWNTDGIGALDALEKKTFVYGKQIVILGAGGAASAIAEEATKRGAHVLIANRTIQRACSLSQQVNGKALLLNQFATRGYDILINCTPACPIDTDHLLPHRVVMDITTTPKMTPLLTAAQAKGCALIYGMDMFIQQAVHQYCHWFNVEN